MKYKTVQTLRLRPGTCLVCRNNTGPAIDTARDVPKHGRVYLCGRCVREMAVALGLPHPDEVQALNETAEQSADQVTELTAQVEQLTDQLKVATSDAFKALVADAAPAKKPAARKPATQKAEADKS